MAYQPHIVAAPNEYKVPFPIHVSISKVQFCRELGSQMLVASGWDGTVHIYQVGAVGHTEERRQYYHGKSVLACTFAGANKVASGGLDQTVMVCDVETGRETNLGTHANAVRCLEYNAYGNVIASGSWDSTVKLWDPRNNAREEIQSAATTDKVYAMDVLGDQIVVGCKDRKILLFDMRNLGSPLQTRESPLKYQCRSISFFPKGEAFVVASIEGRVAIEYIDISPEEQKKKYAFKCHRNKEADGVESIYPVHALAFHPVHGTFASGGSDAMVNIWDPFNRKRLVQLHKFNTSIVSLSFNSDGTQLAIASSYAYEYDQSPSPLPDNTITVRQISDIESRPKT